VDIGILTNEAARVTPGSAAADGAAAMGAGGVGTPPSSDRPRGPPHVASGGSSANCYVRWRPDNDRSALECMAVQWGAGEQSDAYAAAGPHAALMWAMSVRCRG
jgi:hypothetical protein